MSTRSSRVSRTQANFERLLRSCRSAGISIGDLFAKSYPEIVEFAARRGISRLALLEICDTLMEKFDVLERRFEAFAEPNPEFSARNRRLH